MKSLRRLLGIKRRRTMSYTEKIIKSGPKVYKTKKPLDLRLQQELLEKRRAEQAAEQAAEQMRLSALQKEAEKKAIEHKQQQKVQEEQQIKAQPRPERKAPQGPQEIQQQKQTTTPAKEMQSKVDAGLEFIGRSTEPFVPLAEKIGRFIKSSAFTLWALLGATLAAGGALIISLYSKARTSLASVALPDKEPTIKKETPAYPQVRQESVAGSRAAEVKSLMKQAPQRIADAAKPATDKLQPLMNRINKHKQASPLMNWLWRLMVAGLIAGFLFLGIFFIWVATLEIPELGNFADRQVRQSTKIYDKTGEFLLYDVFEDERRTVVPLGSISSNVQKAILATEDDEFYNHHGVRPVALIRSIIQKIQDPTSRLAGGSTITQQVIKNAILTNDRKIERKVKEWVLAWRLENRLSKEEILETYLNEIAFGGAVYGVEQAAISFFGKSASEVSIAESAYLAAVPKAPTFYSPYGNNRDRLDGRQQYILSRMRDLGYISQAQYQEALDEEVEFIVREDTGIFAPHFVFYVIEYLESQYGPEVVERGGLNVITTLDWELQQGLEEVTDEYAEVIPQYGAENLATVAVEVESGKIIGMVGSRGYFDDEIDGKFNIATAFRQPGSTFKPFVYAQAFLEGYTPQTILWDVKTEFSTACYPDGTPILPQYSDRCYSPNNYDNSTRGPLSMQAALAQSLNIPAVKTIYLVGIQDSINMAKKLGITGLNQPANFYGLALVLGGGEVRLLDMVSAYATFGNDGARNAPAAIQEVRDAEGELLEEYEQNEDQVIPTNIARMISRVLSNDDLKRPVFGQNSVLYHGGSQVAVKTGTTNDFKDTWTVGYTPQVSVGVWIGNNDNTPMARRPSSTVAAPYWRKAMDKAREAYPGGSFTPPVYTDPSELLPILSGVWQGSEAIIVDNRTNTIADLTTPEEFQETQYLADYRSILHWLNKDNPRGGGTSQQDSLYEHWEHPIGLWAGASELPTAEDQLLELGLATSTDETAEDEDEDEDEGDEKESLTLDFEIITPTNGQLVDADERQEIEIRTSGPTKDIDRIFYYVNGTYLGSGGASETSSSFVPSSIRTIANTNTVRVVIQTDDDRRIEKETVFEIK